MTMIQPAQPSKINLEWDQLSIVHKEIYQKVSPDTGLLVADSEKTLFKEYRGAYKDDKAIAIASASKWLSAAVIMSLVDDDLIDLSAPAHTYFPDLNKGSKAKITTSQLFSHTSGMRGTHPCILTDAYTLESCAKAIAIDALASEPGTTFSYGGNSMQVAGYIAERVTGKTWAELFKERIAGPLGMNNTVFGTLNLDKSVTTTSKNPRIAGGAKSTLNDYAKFMQMIMNCGTYNGEEILSCDSIKAMEKILNAGMKVGTNPAPEALGYGIGIWIDAMSGSEVKQVSSPGAFGFTPWVDRELGIYGVFMISDNYEQTKDEMRVLQATIRDIATSKNKNKEPKDEEPTKEPIITESGTVTTVE